MCMSGGGGGGPAPAAPVNPYLTTLASTQDSIARSDYRFAGTAGTAKLLADQTAYNTSIAPRPTLTLRGMPERQALNPIGPGEAAPNILATRPRTGTRPVPQGEQPGLQIR